MAHGALIFGPIPTLDPNWWTTPAGIDGVWSTWDRDTVYLWGANAGNYDVLTIGESLQGGGMAGPAGPTRGMAHPHYIGVCTMSARSAALNDVVFAGLAAKLTAGTSVVVPTYEGRCSLGTGIAMGSLAPDEWRAVQRAIFTHLAALAGIARAVVCPPGTYWPHPVDSASALAEIVAGLS